MSPDKMLSDNLTGEGRSLLIETRTICESIEVSYIIGSSKKEISLTVSGVSTRWLELKDRVFKDHEQLTVYLTRVVSKDLRVRSII